MSTELQQRELTERLAHEAQAQTQTEQVITHTAQAETQTEQASLRMAQAETQAEQVITHTAQAETQAKQASTRREQRDVRIKQTKMQAVEQALCDSELSYRRLFEAAQDGILILNAETGRINDANPFLVNLLGFSLEEMLGKTVGELSPFNDVVSNQAMLERLQESGYVRYEDLPLKTKDGRNIAVEFVSNVYWAGDQQVIQCNIRDITKRKQGEITSNLLAAIVESSDDAIYAKDLNNLITSWNRGAEKIYGYLASEMLGTSILRLSPTGHKNEEERTAKEIEDDQKADHIETQRQTKDGRLIQVSVTASPIKDAAGRVIGVSKVARDITQRKQAEAWVRESEEKFRQIAETINEVFWIYELAVDRMIYVSPAYEKIWGRTRKSLYEVPRSWLEVIHAEDRERVIQAATDGPARGEYDEIYRIERPDGSLRWLHTRAFPVRDAAGGVFRSVGTTEDITEIRKLDAQFRQAQKMESIGQLAGGIAHDFNNILSAISGNLYLAKMDAAGHPATLESLENISDAAARATELVRQILTFSRQTKPEREVVKLNQVLLEALKLLRSSLPSTIRIQIELAEVPAVLASTMAIHQVIMNLGTNAWHAMRDQTGVLKIEMNTCEVDEEMAKTNPELHAGRYVQLNVSDTGCGMDRATLEHVFEPFFTTKVVGEGTGLGLAVVHGIMKSHDGAISVYSQPGKGTVFHLYFPVIEAEPAAGQSGAPPIPRGQGEQVLYVDDEEVLAALGQKMLERLGYVVTPKTNPSEALAEVQGAPGKFALVITDLTMPGMDGVALGTELLKVQPGLPIIITSGYAGVMTPAKIRALGFRELLSKPSTARTLGEAVHRVLHARQRTGSGSFSTRAESPR